MRDDKPTPLDVNMLVPGDVVDLAVGDVVPADLRLPRAEGLECDESVVSGEAVPAEKQADGPTATLRGLRAARRDDLDLVGDAAHARKSGDRLERRVARPARSP